MLPATFMIVNTDIISCMCFLYFSVIWHTKDLSWWNTHYFCLNILSES